MAYGKWIGGWLGLMSGGVIGGIAGYVLGALFDKVVAGFDNADESQESAHTYDSRQRAYSAQNARDADGARNGFLFSFMVLCAHVIQADGRIMHSEMETVRRFLRVNFGEIAVEQGNDILLKLFEYRKQRGEQVWNDQITRACVEMRMAMPEGQLLQLLTFLAEVVKADGKVDGTEVEAMRRVALAMGFDASVIDGLLSLGGGSLDDAYRVLGVEPSASDAEVRKAYRELVRRNHPDKVAALGEEVRLAAERKMQEINDAKERVFKARGM